MIPCSPNKMIIGRKGKHRSGESSKDLIAAMAINNKPKPVPCLRKQTAGQVVCDVTSRAPITKEMGNDHESVGSQGSEVLVGLVLDGLLSASWLRLGG
jgi:hypothetical protein